MRILQLTNKPPHPPCDGGSIASYRLAAGLASEGHEVTILAMNTTKHRVGTPGAGEERPEQSLLRVESGRDIRYILVPVDTRIRKMHALLNLLFSRLPYNAVRFESAAYRRRLKQLIATERFDIVILENLYTALYLDDIEKTDGPAVIVRAHNVEHEIWERTARESCGWRKAYFRILAGRIRRFEISLINRYDALVPISQADAERFTALGNKKPVFILQTGIDPDPLATDPSFTPVRSIAHLGALDWLPNQNGIRWFVREVWPRLRKSEPGLQFHLAGRNAPEGFANEMVAAGVTFHGEIGNAASFIRSYPVFIVPLFAGSGMRIKLLEYMAAGRAVISTTLGAGGIPVTHGENILIADHPSDFLSGLMKTLNDHDFCSRLSRNAVAFIRDRYNNQVFIRDFTTFLNRLTDGRPTDSLD